MGEAKIRRDALRRFEPQPADLHVCPRCRGRRTVTEKAPAMGLSHVPTLMTVCADCKAVWEAYPPGWQHDVVGAEPCDNCAFRPGAPEHEDTASWKDLLAQLKGGQEFKCHKGAPILIDAEAGTVEFDAAWVQAHGRTCAGFHRAIMTRPSWFLARYPDLVLEEGDQP